MRYALLGILKSVECGAKIAAKPLDIPNLHHTDIAQVEVLSDVLGIHVRRTVSSFRQLVEPIR